VKLGEENPERVFPRQVSHRLLQYFAFGLSFEGLPLEFKLFI
jgi:hypothetical protein